MASENEIPQYAPSAPVSNPNCLGNSGANGLNIINPPNVGGGGKDAEVLAGFSMLVDDLSDIDTDRFVVNYDPYEAVAVALAIIMKATAVPKTNPILKGTTITDVECSWSYNAARDGDINSQSIINTGAGADPSLSGAARAYNYTGLSILNVDKSVTITGGDGRTVDNDQKLITFGNYLATGVASPSMLFQLPSALQAIFDALNIKTTKTTQAGHSFNAFGTDQEYMTIAHPASWGESAFTKGSFTGGYKRIYSVTRGGNPLLVDEVLGGDTENQILISNGNNGFTEEFYFYQSEFPERTGEDPTIISKL